MLLYFLQTHMVIINEKAAADQTLMLSESGCCTGAQKPQLWGHSKPSSTALCAASKHTASHMGATS